MAEPDIDQIRLPRRNVRLDTLVRIRWLSITAQTATVLAVYFGLEFDLPIVACLAAIALSAGLNIALRLRFRETQRLEPDRAAWLLAFDIAELAALLFLTGGLENPFAFLFLGPVLISATALPPRMTLLLGGFSIVCATVLAFAHYPLPWAPEDAFELPSLYVLAVWLSVLLAAAFIGVNAWQITEESRQLADALAATELVLAREQHLSQIDGLAAAAAHALGTPLSTISVVSRELERALDPASPHLEDVRVLREQAQRCRDILSRLTAMSPDDEPFDHVPFPAIIEEVAAPLREFDVAIDVTVAGESSQPVGPRNPAILYGLGNLLENAVDFARERVAIVARWDAQEVALTIQDDGPGFAPEIITRLGEPYLRGRAGRRLYEGSENAGLGLGFFIAKTLLERSGATVTFANRPVPDHGAVVEIRWKRSEFERPLRLPQIGSSAAA